MKQCLLSSLLLLVGTAAACNGSSRAAAPAAEQTAPAAARAPGKARSDVEPSVSSSSETRQASLTIDGMVCESCAEAAKRTLERVDGVVSAETDFQSGTSTVAFDPSKTNLDALAKAIEAVDRDPAPAFVVTARAERP